MGHRHTRDEILAGALATALADGLSQLTYGRVAKRLGISDRIVVYYFPSKDDLAGAVLTAVATELQTTLGGAFSTGADDHRALAGAARPQLATSEADPLFALFFEANGLAAAGREPYRTVVPQLVEAWIEWVGGFLTGSEQHRRTEAESTIALVDGLLLLRQLAGPAAADRAAARLLGRTATAPRRIPPTLGGAREGAPGSAGRTESTSTK